MAGVYELHDADYLRRPFHSPFKEWHQLQLRRAGIPYPVLIIRAFIEHLHFDKQHSGSLVNSCLSAVRFNLLNSGVDVEFFTHRAARAATERKWRLTHTAADSKTLPASYEFCTFLTSRAQASSNTADFVEHWAQSIMAKMAFTCLLRVSEYCVIASKHFILAGCTSFERKCRCPESGNDIPSFYSPSRVHTIPKAEIYAVDYNVRSAKNDQPGVGHPFHMERVSVSHLPPLTLSVICMTGIVCRPPDDAPCFHGTTAFGPPSQNLIPPSSKWLPASASQPPTCLLIPSV